MCAGWSSAGSSGWSWQLSRSLCGEKSQRDPAGENTLTRCYLFIFLSIFWKNVSKVLRLKAASADPNKFWYDSGSWMTRDDHEDQISPLRGRDEKRPRKGPEAENWLAVLSWWRASKVISKISQDGADVMIKPIRGWEPGWTNNRRTGAQSRENTASTGFTVQSLELLSSGQRGFLHLL